MERFVQIQFYTAIFICRFSVKIGRSGRLLIDDILLCFACIERLVMGGIVKDV